MQSCTFTTGKEGSIFVLITHTRIKELEHVNIIIDLDIIMGHRSTTGCLRLTSKTCLVPYKPSRYFCSGNKFLFIQPWTFTGHACVLLGNPEKGKCSCCIICHTYVFSQEILEKGNAQLLHNMSHVCVLLGNPGKGKCTVVA